jgi:hypothetical protein
LGAATLPCLGAAIELRPRALSEGPVRGGDRTSTVDGGMGASDVNGEHSGGGDRRGPRPSPQRLRRRHGLRHGGHELGRGAGAGAPSWFAGEEGGATGLVATTIEGEGRTVPALCEVEVEGE